MHAPLSHTWSGLQAWATGAPIIADTANSVPTAAKSEVMVRDVDRISRLFPLLESGTLAAKTADRGSPAIFPPLPGSPVGQLKSSAAAARSGLRVSFNAG